ncbi:MAG: FAD-linked oxidase C-terminal domain-containing protein [Acidimicrobiales bacterium]
MPAPGRRRVPHGPRHRRRLPAAHPDGGRRRRGGHRRHRRDLHRARGERGVPRHRSGRGRPVHRGPPAGLARAREARQGDVARGRRRAPPAPARAAGRHRRDRTPSPRALPTIGHAGDGNMHPLLVFDGADAGEVARARAALAEIVGLALRLGGTIAAEHGVGTLKRPFLADELDPVQLAVQRRVRDALDPEGRFNPGKAL